MKKMIRLLSCLILICVQAGPAMAKDAVPSDPADQSAKAGGVKSLEKRVRLLEEVLGRKVAGGTWYDRIQVSGVVEVEAGYQKIDYKDPALDDEESSDVDLAAVELALDAKIIDHVDAHVLFKYEDDDVFVDEGFITLTGTEAFPAYLIAGRQYIPFGGYDSHFISDPNTLILGETNEDAVVIGYRFGGETLDVSIGAFNGKIDKSGDDDVIDSFVAGMTVQPFEALSAGVSYTSNLASSDALSGVIADTDADGEIGPLDDLVGGWSAFVSLQLLDRFKIIGEYVAALDNFKAGELYSTTDTKKRRPSAWNTELGLAITDSVEVAVRYGGSDDGGTDKDFLSETQYGAVLNWGLFERTSLAFEYMHAEFEDDTQETDTFTVQLAVAF